MNSCKHFWWLDYDHDRWHCHDCDIVLSEDAVNILKMQGHEIEIDWERLKKN